MTNRMLQQMNTLVNGFVGHDGDHDNGDHAENVNDTPEPCGESWSWFFLGQYTSDKYKPLINRVSQRVHRRGEHGTTTTE
ncbi:hypothetical protein D3C75_1307200 [compost metagenome]